MDVLNIVFSVLNLLATVIIGVIQVTWMISKDVFRDRPRAKHYSCNQNACRKLRQALLCLFLFTLLPRTRLRSPPREPG